jgi:hypothetical protein
MRRLRARGAAARRSAARVTYHAPTTRTWVRPLICSDIQAVGSAFLGQEGQVLAAIGAAEEHLLAVVAALREVVRNSGNHDACNSGHALKLAWQASRAKKIVAVPNGI